jgi:uncharacterized membrane protein
MLFLVIGLVVFLGVHSVSIVDRASRDTLAARMGNAWRGAYSVIALIGFVLLIWGYGQARVEPVVLYTPPTWLRHLSLLVLMPVFPLLVAAYTKGRIKAVVKHPMLVATKLWAAGHLLANGTLADLLLFGSFLAWAVADRVSVKKRGLDPVIERPNVMHDVIAVVVGLAIYGWFVVQGHAWLIGVAPR